MKGMVGEKVFLRECWSFTWSFDAAAAAVVAVVASAAAEAAEAVVQ